jgi:hypothetical protein
VDIYVVIDKGVIFEQVFKSKTAIAEQFGLTASTLSRNLKNGYWCNGQNAESLFRTILNKQFDFHTHNCKPAICFNHFKQSGAT